ncbi:sterol desaturase-related protein [Candidatus Vecturithrix granuli]|uniref:Sterol desaturase-related protein n=1 Tax=Vecturithrix granuli TaxID=1499967 RepID=A0A081CAF7_VECG1|nr:sterol desaturase-related protein [Candidatus Vecturithrix granuli]
MTTWIIHHEAILRLGAFAVMLGLLTVGELLTPRRPLTASKAVRWYSNLGLVFVNSLTLRWSFPILAVGFASLAQERQWGLFNNIAAPTAVRIIASLLVLDCAIYLQHVMFHAVPLLWRLHRMHHTDLDYDLTTGLRFHPVEIMLSMGIKIGVVAVLGPPAVAVVLFEIILNLTAMFNHSNIMLPLHVDRMLRWFLVTPDMHRVHHSVIHKESDSNFGFSVPWWDYLFGTYRAQPQQGHADMTIGLKEFRDPKYLHLVWLFVQPFLRAEKSITTK